MESEEAHRIYFHDKLIRACRNNDRRAQLKLYNKYSKAMYNVCLNMVNEATDAEDVMQEAFISAFTNINLFKGEVTFGAWLKKITINKCLDFLKKKKLDFDSIDEHYELQIEDNEQSDDHLLKYKAEIIKENILVLPVGYRTILTLYLLEGYDHQEISEILGISSSTSRSQYTRAKAFLIKQLKHKANGQFKEHI